MSSGIGTASASHLEAGDGGRRAAGRITPGFRMPSGSNAASPGGRGHDLSDRRPARSRPARRRPSPCSPEGVPPSGARRRRLSSQHARPRACSQPARVTSGRRFTCTCPSPAWPKSTMRRVARAPSPRARCGCSRPAARPARSRPRSPAASAASPAAARGSGSPRGAAPRAARRSRRVSAVSTAAAQAAHRARPPAPPPGRAPPASSRSISTSRTASAVGQTASPTVGLPHQVEEGPVEQLDRRGLAARAAPRPPAPGRSSDRSSTRSPARCAGMRVEPPVDLGHDAEGPLGADEQVEQVARGEPGVEGVARGVLARCWGKRARDHAARGHGSPGAHLGLEAARPLPRSGRPAPAAAQRASARPSAVTARSPRTQRRTLP